MIRKLTPVIHDKVWGSSLTEPWLANPEGRKIGEIWFAAPDVMPVLVKLLFTSERLSVQVHPGDSYAQAHGHTRGKTEMWHILRAEPGATVALGLRGPSTKEIVARAAVDGSIVELLDWIPAHEGDTFFVKAGTIHAIGGGLVLCEIQQYSDVTYRLFDYKRQPERPLHLEDSLAVAALIPDNCHRESVAVECEYFRAERLSLCGKVECPQGPGPAIYVATGGHGTIAGEAFQAGEAWLVPAGAPSFLIDSDEAAFVIASIPF